MPFSQFELPYGRTESFVFELETDRVMASLLPPKSLTDVAAAAREALQSPIDLPPLSQALVTGDKVVLCVDRSTPQVPQLIAAVWAELDRSGIAAEDVLILHAAGLKGATPGDPRGQLPREVAQKIQWKKHDPGPEEACAYLATTASGERIYLASEVVHADFVMCLGAIGFDPLLGYRGTLSCLYPGLSTTEAMRRMWGGGHVELEPHDPRPLREIIEEIGWLLGTQYHLQVLPGPRGGVAHVFAGAGDAVLKQGKQCLDDEWKLNLSTRPELVIATVDADADGHGWPQLAAALETAQQIVARDGRILLLTDVSGGPVEGIELLRDAHTPREALKSIRAIDRPELETVGKIAQALDRANVYLVSRLEPQLVEDLCIIPLASVEEARRLIEGTEPCVIVGSAQHVFVSLQEKSS